MSDKRDVDRVEPGQRGFERGHSPLEEGGRIRLLHRDLENPTWLKCWNVNYQTTITFLSMTHGEDQTRVPPRRSCPRENGCRLSAARIHSPGPVREEKVELVSGDGLKAYSVVCGSFGVKANAEGLKQYLDGQGYNAKVVYNAERNTYRVIASSYDDRAEATQAKEEFKAKYPNRDDFQKAWLLLHPCSV